MCVVPASSPKKFPGFLLLSVVLTLNCAPRPSSCLPDALVTGSAGATGAQVREGLHVSVNPFPQAPSCTPSHSVVTLKIEAIKVDFSDSPLPVLFLASMPNTAPSPRTVHAPSLGLPSRCGGPHPCWPPQVIAPTGLSCIISILIH